MATNPGPFHPADILIDERRRLYHQLFTTGDLANDILIVGDPRRVTKIADEFLDVNFEEDNRGLHTITGSTKEHGDRISLLTSGMGTPSLEIALVEAINEHEIDLETLTRREPPYPMINIIRVGTSGGIQRETEPGTLIITDYDIGLDNTGIFYQVPHPDRDSKVLERRVRKALNDAVPKGYRFKGDFRPYASRAHPDALKALVDAAQINGDNYKVGITASNAGFNANQGRNVLRIKPTIEDLPLLLERLDTGIPGQKIENNEMEASALFHVMWGLGYRAGAICVAIANRFHGTVNINYDQAMSNASRIGLTALHDLIKSSRPVYSP